MFLHYEEIWKFHIWTTIYLNPKLSTSSCLGRDVRLPCLLRTSCKYFAYCIFSNRWDQNRELSCAEIMLEWRFFRQILFLIYNFLLIISPHIFPHIMIMKNCIPLLKIDIKLFFIRKNVFFAILNFDLFFV